MKILLIGKNGQLGWELHRALYSLGDITGVDYPEIDLSKPKDITPMILKNNPDIVINAAAYTDVDKAESNTESANQINAVAPGIIAEVCHQTHSVFVHYSTDYVFNGEKGSPYIESDVPDPINAYGTSKLAGEQAITGVGGTYLILRTSWVYSMRKGGFVNKVIEWSQKQPTLRIVDDQIGSPTWARMLAQITTLLLANFREDPYAQLGQHAGLYHLAGDGCVSRFEWARAILEGVSEPPGLDIKKLKPAQSSDFPAPARRPSHSGLNCNKFNEVFSLRLPPWRETLRLALNINEINPRPQLRQ